MNELTGFYIKRGDYYLHSVSEDEDQLYYRMIKLYNHRYTTDDLEEILRLNEVVQGIVYASHGCDICV